MKCNKLACPLCYPERNIPTPTPRENSKADDPSGKELPAGAKIIHILPSDVLVIHGLDGYDICQADMDYFRNMFGVSGIMMINGSAEFTIIRAQEPDSDFKTEHDGHGTWCQDCGGRYYYE